MAAGGYNANMVLAHSGRAMIGSKDFIPGGSGMMTDLNKN